MGLFDKLKKKPAAAEPDSEPAAVEESDTGSEDLDSLDLMNAVEIDSPGESSDYSQETEYGEDGNEVKISPPKPEKKKMNPKLIGGLAVCLVLMLMGGGGLVFYLTREPDYQPLVEKSVVEFFTSLSEKGAEAVYNRISPSIQKKFSLEAMKAEIAGSMFLLSGIAKVTCQGSRYVEQKGQGKHGGEFLYEDGQKGFFSLEFEIDKSGPQPKLMVKGFKIESEERRSQYFSNAFAAVESFLKTFDSSQIEAFRQALYPPVRDALGNLKLNLLHSRLVESSFRDVVFKMDDKVEHANTELTFTGFATTKLGTRMKGAITVFWEGGTWFVTMVEFTPVPGV